MYEAELKRHQEKALIGLDAKKILGTDIARYLARKSDEDVDAAFQRFLFLDPHDAKEISECQVAARSALGALKWLEDAVSEGAIALDQYMQLKEAEKEKKEEANEE